MTFDEAFELLYTRIFKYCIGRFHGDSFLAEDATNKAFIVLNRKWDTLASHEEKFLTSWLFGAVRYTTKEVKRETAANVISLDEEWCVSMIEQEQINSGTTYNEVFEDQKYEDYIAAIEKSLNSADRHVFHRIVVDNCPISKISEELQATENSVRVRWSRLQRKIEPLVRALIK